MKNKKLKKKANIIILSLFCIMGFATITGIFINYRMNYEVYNRLKTAVEDGANIRAQAIDIYLKESTGIVETYHPTLNSPEQYGVGQFADIDHSSGTVVDEHVTALDPTSEIYQSKRIQADNAAKQAVASIVETSLSDTAQGNKIIQSFSKGDVCIDVQPLPRNSSLGSHIDFQCTTDNGETLTAENVKVTPIEGIGKHKEGPNRRVVSDPDPNIIGDERITEAVNIVFVGASVEHKNFLENLFPALFKNSDSSEYDISKKTVWATAYPQIDKCFGKYCAEN